MCCWDTHAITLCSTSSNHVLRSKVPCCWVTCAILLCSASAVVFANKTVFAVHGFRFTYTLTLIHTLFTFVGMWVMSSGMGLFVVKPLPLGKVTPLAAAFVGEHRASTFIDTDGASMLSGSISEIVVNVTLLQDTSSSAT